MPWPDSTIYYCFDTSDSRDKLKDPVVQAMKIWYAAGLPEEKFKMVELTDSRCQSERSDILMITYSDHLSSSVGKIPANPQIGVAGPNMNLVVDSTVGMLDPIANIAHELGHAWGLYHEHQRPELWDGQYAMGQLGDQEFIFNCQNLKDYQAMSQKLSADDLQRACTERSFASQQKFSAAEFLPQFFLGKSPGYGTPVDRDSLMIYASGCGGTGSASSPDNDNRADVLLYADGSKILPRQAPSKGDIDALIALYDGLDSKPPDSLINEPKNPKVGKFRKLIGKMKGSGHCL